MKLTLLPAIAVMVAFAFGTTSSAIADIVVVNQLQVGTTGPYTAVDYYDAPLSDVAWFQFNLDSATNINVDFNRTSAPPDLFASLWEGSVVGFDVDTLGGHHADIRLSSVGPLTFVSWRDDSHDDGFGGPFGDPQFILLLGPGVYTIAVSALEGAGGEFTVTSNVTGVPEPSSLALLCGLGSLFTLRRRRKRPQKC